MTKRTLTIISALVLISFITTGCSFTSRAVTFNGVGTPDGTALSHQSTTNVAIHAMISKPLIDDATLEKTVDDFTMAAKEHGASKVRIVQSKVMALWFILPPISFFLTPTISNVSGDTYK